jgi:hypothetical protein
MVGRRVHVTLATHHRISIEHAWWCPDFNVRIPTIQLAMHYGGAPSEGSFQLRNRRSRQPSHV